MNSRRCIVAAQPGEPSVLAEAELPLNPLGPTEVRVKTAYCGVNFWDVMQRRGNVPLPPDHVPGVEGSGVVIEIGDDVPASMVGTRVAWSRVPSSYSTVAQGPMSSFIPLPDAVSDTTAASVLMQGITAQYLAESTTDLQAGDTALVMAAAGGVGSLLTQFLLARGVQVIGVVSSQEKVAAAESAGSRALVDSDQLADDVTAMAPDGVDAVFDANGGDVNRLISLVGRRGICVLYGSASGTINSIDPGLLANGSRYLTRTAGRDYAATLDEWRERADDVLSRAAAGTLAPVAVDVLDLKEAPEAHRRLESRRTTGKLLLKP